MLKTIHGITQIGHGHGHTTIHFTIGRGDIMTHGGIQYGDLLGILVGDQAGDQIGVSHGDRDGIRDGILAGVQVGVLDLGLVQFQLLHQDHKPALAHRELMHQPLLVAAHVLP